MNNLKAGGLQRRKIGATRATTDEQAIRRVSKRGGGRAHAGLFAVWNRKDQALRLFLSSPLERVDMIKAGFPSRYVKVLTGRMNMPIDRFYRTIGLARPTIDRKIRTAKALNQDESERVMGVARLVGQAQCQVEESGKAAEFDAARWVGRWLELPLPALGGRAPGDLMDTVDGRALVADLLAQQQSGAYG
jgi:putative toxin-antitoxin system antitoxin component (TIGR02293 family)